MSPLELVAILVAGAAAGAINTVVGSGTLITFPTLIALGVPPITANASNTIGLVPGSLSGAWGYRRELVGQRARLLRFASASALGGVLGAVLLFTLPDDAFAAIVPVLILLGLVLVVTGPRISKAIARRREERGAGEVPEHGPRWLWPVVALTGVYGGYFGAAQGIILMAFLGIGLPETLQRLNAMKNLLVALVNGISGVLFAIFVDVDWTVVLLVGVGAVVGAQLGARYGRKLPDHVLRGFIVVVGVAALAAFLLG
ncbi:sulfite exporter TauE/SafE family protein [Nocardioides sp. ChNu-153]|uniref:sulfite exporter TauE/SafE family protein n=1 Tax=unclassified Nocardioides TaxID=2615069 RepID=UPI002405EB57|nr:MULTISPECIES: sulfite exporter TauE/SafE family protein [unclassified Nocardioides]MDF9715278.1 sulfite exporter TauE/SafE family protein [Nocardioides sp. ChNu-99]MDN7122511.1 sulfite exporter TauE/SafE family protein [Nocardioides sp. ChNu-153]